MSPLAPLTWLAFLLAAPPQPAYALEASPAKTIDATYTFDVHSPRMAATEWVVYAARPPELPGQTKVRATLEPKGKEVNELSALRRRILLALVPGKGGH